MRKRKNSHVSLAKSVKASLTFGHTSLYEKLLEISAADDPDHNIWDDYIWDIFENSFNICFDNILDDELRLKLYCIL